MQINIRKAIPADAPAIARLLVLAWQKAYRGILSDARLASQNVDERTQKIQNGIATRLDFRYHVLEADGDIAGISLCCPCSDADLTKALEIQAFYIHPHYQRQGLGRILMRHTLADLRASGDAAIALWVLKENHNARAFYEQMGFMADSAEKLLAHLDNAPVVRYRYTG